FLIVVWVPGILVGVPVDRDTSGLAVEFRRGAAVRCGKGAEGVVGRQRHEDVVVLGISSDRVGGPSGVLTRGGPRQQRRHIICGQLLQDLLVLCVDDTERGSTLGGGSGKRAEWTAAAGGIVISVAGV